MQTQGTHGLADLIQTDGIALSKELLRRAMQEGDLYRHAVSQTMESDPQLEGIFKEVYRTLKGSIPENQTDLALVHQASNGKPNRYTYGQLYETINQVASSLQLLGIGAGEVVSLWLPCIPEWIIATLACISLGCKPASIPIEQIDENDLTTFLQTSKARVLIVANWCMLDGNPFPTKSIAEKASIFAPYLESIITVRHLELSVSWLDGRDILWDQLLAGC